MRKLREARHGESELKAGERDIESDKRGKRYRQETSEGRNQTETR